MASIEPCLIRVSCHRAGFAGQVRSTPQHNVDMATIESASNSADGERNFTIKASGLFAL
jgi:hypothetical protein